MEIRSVVLHFPTQYGMVYLSGEIPEAPVIPDP